MTTNAIRVMLLLVIVLCSTVAIAGPSSAEAGGTVRVTGDVHSVLEVTTEQLKTYPKHTVAVTFQTDSGPEHHVYEGCFLETLISAARPIVNEAARHPLLTVAVVATGADGYAVALSWADLTPTLTPEPAMIAWSEDGSPLGRPRLVVPGDVGGARYVKDVHQLDVTSLAP